MFPDISSSYALVSKEAFKITLIYLFWGREGERERESERASVSTEGAEREGERESWSLISQNVKS